MRSRRSTADKKQRPEYEGMGLGLFIAKTLLERSGAQLRFANGSDPYSGDGNDTAHSGAIVEVIWPRDAIDGKSGANAVPTGLNQRNAL